ncbi:hypothetical protein Taro_009173 [Colocasia esculenta]|uniref:Uncharacterized protein n=1 Tax=Colocasia esculenta TaxID=4460 RepID=A0A843U488_COLES|nr:hypothetical protein [Colocasia esculenta]
MAHHKPINSLRFFALFISFLFLCSSKPTQGGNHGNDQDGRHAGAAPRLQTYIVRVQQPETATFAGPEERERWYRSFLSVEAAAEDAGMGERRLVHSYHEVFTGFAARLTEEEVTAMKKKEGFLHAYRDSVLHPATTHSPEFIGLQLGSGLWGGGGADGLLGEGVIVGMIDSGITPGHPSFKDEGMPPPPSRWKGSCQPPEFCNKKIIGSKTFITGNETATPADDDGHGTHTASTVAGSFVKGANILGNANGTASGVAPRAHLAIYKVCTTSKCQLSDTLAGIDAAVADGVDIISISLAGNPLLLIHNDVITVGAFGATKRGVFVSCAAGNFGDPNTVVNDAPWELTVGASTMDRSIVANVKLGDGSIFHGESLFQPAGFTHKVLPLVCPGTNLSNDSPAFTCQPKFLAGVDLKGKIVLCESGGGISPQDKGAAVLKAGAAGMILMNEEFSDTILAVAHVLPATHVNYTDGYKIREYVRASNHPTASILFEGTMLGFSSPPAPAVASFSSRGPSGLSPGIVKPDIIGPGVNILAAWPSPVRSVPSASPHSGGAYFNIISGTSMSTPHLSGVAALLKSAHPDWSPAAIRSAILTTAYIRRNDGTFIRDDGLRFGQASVFDIGAGHVNASSAADPGLVYDLGTSDYVAYICGLGYTDEQVTAMVGERVSCSAITRISREQLNYPSISVQLTEKSPTVALSRTVTNVGEATETYKVEVDLRVAPGERNLTLSVIPQTLSFSAVKEKQRFTVTFSKPVGDTMFSIQEGSLQLVSAKHVVRIPIAITLNPL